MKRLVNSTDPEPNAIPITQTNIIGTFELRFSDWVQHGPHKEWYLLIKKEGFKPYCTNILEIKTLNGGAFIGQFNTRILNTFTLEPKE
jgi:hypothetical protein